MKEWGACKVFRKNLVYLTRMMADELPVIPIMMLIFSGISLFFDLGAEVYGIFLTTMASVFTATILCQLMVIDYANDGAFRYSLPISTGEYIDGTYLFGLFATGVGAVLYGAAAWLCYRLVHWALPVPGYEMVPWETLAFPFPVLLGLSGLFPVFILNKNRYAPVIQRYAGSGVLMVTIMLSTIGVFDGRQSGLGGLPGFLAGRYLAGLGVYLVSYLATRAAARGKKL